MGAYFMIRTVAWIGAALVFPFWLGWTDTPWFIAAFWVLAAGLAFGVDELLIQRQLTPYFDNARRRRALGGFASKWVMHTLRMAPPIALGFIVGRVVH